MPLKMSVSGVEPLRKSYVSELLHLSTQCQWMILCSSELPLRPDEVKALLRQNISCYPPETFASGNYLRHATRQILWERILDRENSLLRATTEELNELVAWWIPFEDSEDILRHLAVSRHLEACPLTAQMALRRGWNECNADWIGNDEKTALWVKALQECAARWPEYVAGLEQEWLEILRKDTGSTTWQAGWLGLAMVGRERDEPFLARIMGEKLRAYAGSGREKNLKWMGGLEWTGMLQVLMTWRPKNPVIRKDVRRQWEEMATLTGEWWWRWRAAFLLEDDEEELFRQLQDETEPWEIFTRMGPWYPRDPAIHRKAQAFWKCMLGTVAVKNPAAGEVIWGHLVQLAPHDRELTEWVETFLFLEEQDAALAVIADWFEKDGVAAEMTEQTRLRLLKSIRKRLQDMENDGKDRYVGESLRSIAFQLLIENVQPETESGVEEEWRDIFSAIEKNSLARITWWYKIRGQPRHRRWGRLLQRLWGERLSLTDWREKKAALHYLGWITREDMSGQIDAELTGKLKWILEEERNSDVYLAAVLLARQLSRPEGSHWRNWLWEALIGRNPEIRVKDISLSRFFMREFLLERIEELFSEAERNGWTVDQSTLFRWLRALLHVFPGDRPENGCHRRHITPLSQAWNDEIKAVMKELWGGRDGMNAERPWPEVKLHFEESGKEAEWDDPQRWGCRELVAE